MATLQELRTILTGPLGFAPHHIVDSNGDGVAPELAGAPERAAFVVRTQAGNCYACFRHSAAALSEVEANRYKALALLLPGGPAAYCVVEVGGRLRLFASERGNELALQPPQYDRVGDAEEMVRELLQHKAAVAERQQWARRTLGTDNSLARFVQILEGCWQDIWDIQNKRNDWIFDEFTKVLFIKLHEDSKGHDSELTLARLDSYCRENEHMGRRRRRRSSTACSIG
jgi:type I restriction enzyme M protein